MNQRDATDKRSLLYRQCIAIINESKEQKQKMLVTSKLCFCQHPLNISLTNGFSLWFQASNTVGKCQAPMIIVGHMVGCLIFWLLDWFNKSTCCRDQLQLDVILFPLFALADRFRRGLHVIIHLQKEPADCASGVILFRSMFPHTNQWNDSP